VANLHYERISIVERDDPLVDLSTYPFLCEPAYYRLGYTDTPKLFTRRMIAQKLLLLQEQHLINYQFKIWDPWRPRAVQRKLFEACWAQIKGRNPDWTAERIGQEVPLYVADPDRLDRVPSHATGGSIDLTLVDRKTGHELDMGTGFDHFGPEAAPHYFEQKPDHQAICDHRRLLQGAMASVGFTQDPDEWWHFDYGNQKWAEAAGEKEAFFGEVVSP